MLFSFSGYCEWWGCKDYLAHVYGEHCLVYWEHDKYWVTGSLCRFIFIVLKTLFNYFQTSCTNLYSLQQWMRVHLFPRPLKGCYPLFADLSHSDWDKLKVEVVIKYIVLNCKNNKYFLICLPCLFWLLRTVHKIHSASCFQHLHL